VALLAGLLTARESSLDWAAFGHQRPRGQRVNWSPGKSMNYILTLWTAFAFSYSFEIDDANTSFNESMYRLL